MTIMRLGKRETAVVGGGLAAILALLYLFLVVWPLLERQEELARQIKTREGDLEKMHQLAMTWEKFKNDKTRFEGRAERKEEGFTLLSFLEGISREAGIQKNIQYMKPRPAAEDSEGLKSEGMEIRLEDVEMDRLVSFLYSIEYSGRMLGVGRIKIQKVPKGQEESLRVILQVDAYTRG